MDSTMYGLEVGILTIEGVELQKGLSEGGPWTVEVNADEHMTFRIHDAIPLSLPDLDISTLRVHAYLY